MKFDLVDIALFIIIFSIVFYYAYIRYREEKKKKEEQLIPNLKSYLEKLRKEKNEYSLKAEKFNDKIKIYSQKLKKIKENIGKYKWEKDDKKYLKSLKGTDFEWTFSFMLSILGFKVQETPVYKDKNIDFIVEIKGKKLCVDFVDFNQLKKIDEKYLDTLIKGKEKYRCNGIWIITNSKVDKETKKKVKKKGIYIWDYTDILQFFPSIMIVEDFYETETKLHNYELLHKETTDEIIRRETWIKEVEKKLEEAYRKKGKEER
ncbi:Restriction endonuclease [Persephonella hydrogeniphila]|uniref:Restriction endonuclease n=1 Tax=Persephonella hydrogeniphila TaxID=198703 RepID=A0A285NJH2_9AQUI|nr:restriction endonuclease [Persephonella hydrogeniphila]SNZ09418.1 Restriction endonuclease [Persephonella hydrogeniphila]